MNPFYLEKHSEGQYFVGGDLTFFSLTKKTIKSFDFLNINEPLCIDFIDVNKADSAGLALMVEWIKQSKQYNTLLTFKNIPQQLLTLARLSGFEKNEYFNQ